MSGARFPWRQAIYLAVFLALLAAAAQYYRAQEGMFRREVEANLLSIANLKAAQIAQWRGERLKDAAALGDSAFMIEAIARWLTRPEPALTARLQARLDGMRLGRHVQEVMLVDAQGRVRLQARDQPVEALNALEMAALEQALRTRRPVLTDLHVNADAPAAPHVNVIAPLFGDGGRAGAPIGALMLSSAADRFLYPLLQSWPMATSSAETLLVRRDGDAVLFLNGLRHQSDTALKLRIPLSRRDVPAVAAVGGREGMVAGTDYRGVDVVSVLKAVPDSPWFMVAKVDTAEALAAWRRQSATLLALIGTLLAAAAGALVWQRNAAGQYRALFEAETARREGEQRYRVTLMSIGDAVIATDGQGHVVMMNPVAETLTGWREGDAAGRPLEEVFVIINEDTRLPVESPVTHVLRAGIIVGLANHTLLLAKDGSERPIADSGAPIFDAGGATTGVVLVFRDQSDERRAHDELDRHRQHLEELVASRTAELAAAKAVAETASEAKSAFLANISHEIRTPMNAVLGFIHLLRRRNQDGEQQGMLDKMAAAAHHLLSVINQVLDLAKIEAGKLALDEADFNLKQTLDSVCAMVRDQTQACGLELSATIEPALLRALRGDPTRLGQALLNYLGNAIKFTERGMIAIHAGVVEERDGDFLVRFEVRDTGIGIAPQAQARLFAAFEQIDGSATRKYGGSGLGLAITRHLAQSMGGEVGVDSQPGVGSRFWFTARLAKAGLAIDAAPETGGESEAERALRQDYGGVRILLAEDNEINRDVLVGMLADAGLTADVAVDGAAAVAMAQRTRYDLILMDMQMPVMDGIAATRAIRVLPQGGSVPILAMTANAFEADRERCLAAGMNAHVAKPVDPARLFAALLHWLPRPVAPTLPAPALPAAAGDDALRARLEAIPGLDAAYGLKNLGGRVERYHGLLRKYADGIDGEYGGLRELIAAGDHDAAQRLTHNIKGMAGFLGAIRVQELAAELDAALRARRDGSEVDAMAAAFVDAMAAAFVDAQAQLAASLRALDAPALPNG